MTTPKDIESVISEFNEKFPLQDNDDEESIEACNEVRRFILHTYSSALAWGAENLPRYAEPADEYGLGRRFGIGECRSTLLEKAEEIMNKKV